MIKRDEKKKCACEGGTLTRFIQPVILSILSKESMTGYKLIQDMLNYSIFENDPPDQAGVYRYIKIMINRGYIEQVPSKTGGENNILSLTPAGIKCLNNWRKTLNRYYNDLALLLKQL